jgi:hypothetical protein
MLPNEFLLSESNEKDRIQFIEILFVPYTQDYILLSSPQNHLKKS